MKKFLAVAAAALCVAAVLPQSLAAGVGIKGGLALSKFAVTPADSVPFPIQNLSGPVAGVYFNLGLGLVSFEADALYVRMGFKTSVEDATMEDRLNYIQVPVMLKVKVIPAGPIRPFIFAGGYGSYLLNAKGVMTSSEGSDSGDITDMWQRYDYGAVGGVGVTFKLPGLTLSAEGRYNLGLANIAKDVEEGESAKNRSIMFLVGVGF
jgi:hypothetical protein